VAARYDAETFALEWRKRLVCSQCGSRQVDVVVTGKRNPAVRWVRQFNRATSNTPGTANRIASAKSSPVVKSSALARSTSLREMVMVTLA
jgi:hypothetical protein